MRKRLLSLAAAPFIIVITISPVVLARDIPDPAFWLTPGGGIAWPPAEFGFGRNSVEGSAPTFGGILGFKVAPPLGFELRGHLLTEEDLANLDLMHGEGNVTWLLAPGRQVVPLLTGGAGVIRAKNDAGEDDQFLWNVGGGLLVKFTDNLGLRVDGRYLSYEVIDFLGEESFRPHTEVFAGLNLGFGGRPKDSDRDGIPNRTDACPNTRIGARVDARGCPIDGDKDTVPDGIDQCEGTPHGATVDPMGCPKDTDGDGVYDGLDECADTPAEASVDAKGCGLDSDGDGVFDGIDRCEGTPDGCTVNAEGCPSDADDDGVCDGVDACADTPADASVDRKGCPIVVTEKETELLETGMIRLQNVNFDSGKATLKAESFAVLDEVGEILGRWPELRVEIGGHTDSQGSDAFNQTLSENRAKTVLDYLTGKFPALKAGQLTSAGYGETLPIAPNDNALNRARNRRVEFKVLNTDALKRETERTRFAPKN